MQHLVRCNPNVNILGCLTRCLVQAFEQTERLPLRLYALLPNLHRTNYNMSNSSPLTESINEARLQQQPVISEASLPVHQPRGDDVGNGDANCFTPVPLGILKSFTSALSNQSLQERDRASNLHRFCDCMDESEMRALLSVSSMSLHVPYSKLYPLVGVSQITRCCNFTVLKLTTESTGEDTGTNSGGGGAAAAEELVDWSKRTVSTNLLNTVGQVEDFLLRLSTKQW